MKLFLVHCGFYDNDIAGGLYENHSNLLVCADDFEEARQKVKAMADFKGKKMHIDGLMEIEAVDGYRIDCKKDPSADGKTIVSNLKYGSRTPRRVELSP